MIIMETAGLVLASIPICIEALKQYQKIWRAWQLFRHKSLYIDRLITALSAQKVLIELEVKLILKAIGIEWYEFEDLGSPKGLVLLARTDVEEGVRDYLGEAYEPFQKLLIDCEKILSGIAMRIGNLTTEKATSGDLKELVKANTPVNGKYEWTRRLKFSLKKQQLDERIKELNEGTNMLNRLRSSRSQLTGNSATTSSWKSLNLAIFLRDVRKHTNSLYWAISKTYSEQCHERHGTELYLESRTNILDNKPNALSFGIVFAPACSPNEPPPESHQAVIELIAKDANSLANSASPSLYILRGICQSVAEAKKNDKLLKLYLDNSQLMSSQSDGPAMASRDPKDSITLAQILNESSDNMRQPKHWSLYHRMVLALKLASSLLQLYKTPWLDDGWNNNSIHFLLRGPPSSPNTFSTFEVDNPFIVRIFPEHCPIDTGLKTRTQLLDLGIILLELWHETSFDAYISASAPFLQEAWKEDRSKGARHWLYETEEQILPYYFDAILTCIDKNIDIESVKSYRTICDGVIGPLWQNCRWKVARGT